MRIHTSLDSGAFYRAARVAYVHFERFAQYGSRSHDRAFDVLLSGSSGRRAQMGNDWEAASWDEWGIFLGVIFDFDPMAKCAGGGGYENGDHFHWSTGNRFRNVGKLEPALTWADQHRQHHWGYGELNVTGAYSLSGCKCGALRRWLTYGTSWGERVGAA